MQSVEQIILAQRETRLAELGVLTDGAEPQAEQAGKQPFHRLRATQEADHDDAQKTPA